MKIMVGTPMYGGSCTSDYTESILKLNTELNKMGHSIYPGFLSNESLIQRGRNTIAYHFLNSDADYLLFIDADIYFRTEDVLRMIASRKELIIGPVPLKGFNWENIKNAALQDKKELANYSGIFNIVNLPNVYMKNENEPFEIAHGGCALMLIHRSVLDQLKPYTDYYVNGGATIANNKKVYNFFRVEIEKNSKLLLSEDYFFCHSYRTIGGKVWCAPWCQTGHLGSYQFNGVYASVSASATNGE